MAAVDTEGFMKHLKSWGLKLEETDGWRSRGRPYSFYPRAVMCHHTASNKNSGNKPAENIVKNGRSDLPGPLSQFLLARDGTVVLIAAGYCNHAGYGGPIAGIPANSGNTYSWGIEAENDGIGESWPAVQLNAYYQLCAALLSWMNIKDVSKVFGHKEWTSRKIDPGGLDMNVFRDRVRDALEYGPVVKTVSLAKLQPGKRNDDILIVKTKLHEKGFSLGDEKTKFFGKKSQLDYSNWQKSLGYSDEKATGIPDKRSLRKLGLWVTE